MAKKQEMHDRLLLMRKMREMTQLDLAQKTHISKGAISQFERGIIGLRAELIGRIAVALNTTTDYLILGKEHVDKRITPIYKQLIDRLMANEKFKMMLTVVDDKELNDLLYQIQEYQGHSE